MAPSAAAFRCPCSNSSSGYILGARLSAVALVSSKAYASGGGGSKLGFIRDYTNMSDTKVATGRFSVLSSDFSSGTVMLVRFSTCKVVFSMAE